MKGSEAVRSLKRGGMVASVALLLSAAATVGVRGGAASATTGCQPSACVPGLTVGLTTTANGKTVPIPAAAGLYGWGMATQPDGSVLVGDYWNYRIVHYLDNEINGAGGTPPTPATPYVFNQSTVGNGPGTNQAPYGICVDTDTSSPDYGHVYMTEGSLYDVVAYDANGNWLASWGTAKTKPTTVVNFTYPSQCAVSPTTGLVYVSNQWGQSVVVLDPTNTQPAQFDSPPSPDTFIQPRGLAFDSAGNLWIADQGHRRIDIFYASAGLNLNSAPNKTIAAPPCSPSVPTCTSTTFDMRGLAIDPTAKLAFVANGQGCVVQEFNADPASSGYGAFLSNFNGVPAGGSDCGTGNGQFEDGARGIAVDGNHDVWVGDLGGFRAQVFDETGTFQFSVPSPPSPPPTGGFNGPRGVAFDPSGDMFVTDTYNERVEEFSPDGHGGYTFFQQWGMRGDVPASFNYPRLDCWDPNTPSSNGAGALIVANTDSNEIVAWDPSANPPAVKWASVAPPKSAGTLANPYGVSCDPSTGYVYVADSNDSDVVVFSATGTQLGTIGNGTISGFGRGIWVDSLDGSVWVDVSAPSGTVYHFASWASGGGLLGSFPTLPGGNPFGIAGDATHLYVALSSTNEVAQYSRSGTLMGTFGGRGTAVGSMMIPQGLAFAPDGRLYVVEQGNNRVSQWNVSGSTPPPVFSKSMGGPGHAQLYPSGMDIDSSGNAIIADTGNSQIAAYTTVASSNGPAGTQLWRVGTWGPGTNQFNDPRDLAIDQTNGDIFVADNANGRIVELDSAGNWVRAWRGKPGLTSPIGIGVANGLVYVAEGGRSDIRVFDETGQDVQTIVANGTCNLAQSRDVDADSAGNIFVANYEKDDVAVFNPDGSCQTTWGTKGSGNGQFKNPYGIRVGFDPVLGQEAVWVADSNNNRLQEFTPSGQYVTQIGSTGNDSHPGTFTALRRVALATDGSGNIWGADLWGNRVEQFVRGSTGYTYALTIPTPPSQPPLTNNAVYNQVREVAFDSSGDLYSIDTVNQRFVEMDPSGNILGACGTRGFAYIGEFNWPRGIMVDPGTGNVWIADTKQSDLQILTPPTASPACEGVARFGTAGTHLGSLNYPTSLALNASDSTVWVADSKNNRIVSYNLSTHAPIAEYGSLGSGPGQFSQPTGVAVDPANGNILVADTNNNRVVELSESAGSVTGVVGIFTDSLKQPQGVAADASGNILIADTGHSLVKATDPAGSPLWTISGTGTQSFNQPGDVTVGPTGNFVVSDTINDVLDVFTPGA